MRYGLVERRRRAVARVALYSSLLVVAVGTWLGTRYLQLPLRAGVESVWLARDWASDPPSQLLQQYLRIDTTEATGDEYAAALFLSTPLEAAGIPTHIERMGDHHANLWAILEGDDPRPLVLLSHLDVEPIVDVSQWEHPPLAAAVDGPWVFGRGAFDMKSYTVAQLFAFLSLAAEHPRPHRTVILLATSNEETGGYLGIKWLLRERPELLRDAWAVLNEGGIVEARTLAEIKYWGLEVGQKRFVDLDACAPNEQRLLDLRKDLQEFGFGATGLEVDEEVTRFWAGYRGSRDRRDLRDLLEDPGVFLHDPARFRKLPAYLQSMLRNEAVPFRPVQDADGSWHMRIVLHLLPSADAERAFAELVPAWMLPGVQISLVDHPPPAKLSPTDHPVLGTIAHEVRRTYGRAPVGPYFLAWTATDSRYLRAAGIPSYGFAPFLMLTPDTLRIGNPDERMPLSPLVQGTALYTRLVETLAQTRQARR